MLRSRSGTIVVAGIGVLALGAAAAFASAQYMDRAAVESTSPGRGQAVPTARPTIVVTTANAGRVSDLHMTLDGRDVTRRVRGAGNRLVLQAGRLRQGRHTAEIGFSTRNVFSRSVSRRWTFTIDTKRPALALASPARGAVVNHRKVRFKGTGEPRARVRVTWKGGSRTVRVNRRGKWSLIARLPEGRVSTKVLALDRAGNGTASLRGVLVDTSAPVLRLNRPNGGKALTATDEPLLYGSIPNDSPGRLTFGAVINGKPVAAVRGAAAAAAASGAYTEAGVSSAPAGTSVQVEGHRFTLSLGKLPQGLNRITVWVRDPAGNMARRRMRVMVDSTSLFGASTMVAGARGDDVVGLQERLGSLGLYRGKPTGRYGKGTIAAVRRYQRRFDLGVDGQVGQATLRKMAGRIVIDLSAFQLSLIRDGRTAMSFPVAVGQAAYPTPTGTYAIVTKQVDPTWLPPNSPWASGLGPIPPGPGNPLGTRWIGTSAPAVGIHGTPADYTIGTAASHGCIRMHIPDVEKLYDQVQVGMEVDIVS
jgi:lipoprotein-anchoring transpeptidase ErfK/SrfK